MNETVTTQPKVSVICACYNSAEFINDTIESIISQSYENWELICVDDGSKDDTLNILRAFEKRDGRIKAFSKPNSGRAAPALNVALTHCSGKYGFGIGHDDQLSPDFLEKTVQRALETGADIVIPDCFFIHKDNPEKNSFYIGPDFFPAKTPIEGVDRSVILSPMEACILSINWKIHAFALYAMHIMKKIGYSEEGMNGDEFSARLFLLNANKIAFSEGRYYYNQIPTSITKKASVRYFDTFITDKKIYSLCKELNLDDMFIKKFRSGCLRKYAQHYFKFKRQKPEFSEQEREAIQKIFCEAKKWLNFTFCEYVKYMRKYFIKYLRRRYLKHSS